MFIGCLVLFASKSVVGRCQNDMSVGSKTGGKYNLPTYIPSVGFDDGVF